LVAQSFPFDAFILSFDQNACVYGRMHGHRSTVRLRLYRRANTSSRNFH
jgi:hypothetical protein